MTKKGSVKGGRSVAMGQITTAQPLKPHEFVTLQLSRSGDGQDSIRPSAQGPQGLPNQATKGCVLIRS